MNDDLLIAGMLEGSLSDPIVIKFESLTKALSLNLTTVAIRNPKVATKW
jgi:hypothetical protein